MTILEKLAELDLDYRIDFDHELVIYGEKDEWDDEGNDKDALLKMREWVNTHKMAYHSGDAYVDGYLVEFQDDLLTDCMCM